MGKMFFHIPENQIVMAPLVAAVPDNWSWVDGVLNVPQGLVSPALITWETGFRLSRFHDIHPTIVGKYIGKGQRAVPDLYGIMVEQKWPESLLLDEAGYENRILTLSLVKKIIVGFVGRGYRGRLDFFSGCRDNKKYHNPARCEMLFTANAEERRSLVVLEWNEYYGGKEEDVEPILNVCLMYGSQIDDPQTAEAK